jgi:hypothetical protein
MDTKKNETDRGLLEIELSRCPPTGGITSDESFDSNGEFVLNLNDIE